MAAFTTWTPGGCNNPCKHQGWCGSQQWIRAEGSYGDGDRNILAWPRTKQLVSQQEQYSHWEIQDDDDEVTCMLSREQIFVTPWTVAHQAPLSVGLPRQEYWSGLPFPPPGGVPDPRIKPSSPASPALRLYSLPLSHLRIPDKGTPSCLFLHRASFWTQNPSTKEEAGGNPGGPAVRTWHFHCRRVQSLVRELRSCKHCSMAKK